MSAVVPQLQSAAPDAPIMNYRGGVVSATWAGLLDDATPGQALPASNFVLNAVQVFGEFGVGGSIQMEGSNDGEHWAILPDINDDPAVLATSGIIFFKESTVYVRPYVTAGDLTTSLTAIASLRRQPNG